MRMKTMDREFHVDVEDMTDRKRWPCITKLIF